MIRARLPVLLLMLLTLSLFCSGQANRDRDTQLWGGTTGPVTGGTGGLSSGTAFSFLDSAGTISNQFEIVAAGTAASTLTATVTGCMRGGTCSSTLSTNSGVASQLLPIASGGPYDSYKVTVTWTGGDATTTFRVNRTGVMARLPTGGPALSPGVNTGYGFDVRAFGALLNGTGVTGVGKDDSTAINLCLAAFQTCIIPAVKSGATTHVRWATPQIIAPLTDGGRKLICVGENQQDSSGGSTGIISIDVDMGGGTAGPALWLGSQNVSLQQGLSIDNGCRFRDISASHNSPGAIGMMNTSNNEIDAGITGFQLAPLGIPISPASVASCTLTGGSISSAGSLFRQDEQLGPGWGSSLPSVEVSATAVAAGCSSGSTCSCTPTAPTLTAGAVADIVLLSTTSGTERQVGMPYSCPAANCGAMGTLFNYSSPTTSATPIAAIQVTGNKPNVFDHSGASGFLIMGTAGMNASNNGGVAGSTVYSNQPKFANTDCYNNNSCFDFEHNVAMAEIIQAHIRIQNGKFGIQNEYNGQFNLSNFHIENIPVSGSGAGLNLSGAPNIANGLIESGNVSTGINAVALSGANISGTACGASVGNCFTDDVTSSGNNIQVSNIQGTVTLQPTDNWCGGGFCKFLQTLAVTTADITCGTGGTIASCTGFQTILTRALPSNVLNWGFMCDFVVSQATAAVSNQVAVATTNHAPTNLTASAYPGANTSASTNTPVTDVSATGAQTLLAYTPSAIGTKVPIHVSGFIEGTTVTGTTFNLAVNTGSNADLLTVYRGASCWLY